MEIKIAVTRNMEIGQTNPIPDVVKRGSLRNYGETINASARDGGYHKYTQPDRLVVIVN